MRAFFTRHKIYYQRGYSLIGTLGIAYLVATQVQAQILAHTGISISILWLIPTGVVGLWFVGMVEFRLGLLQSEQEFMWDENPAYTRLKNKKTTHGVKR